MSDLKLQGEVSMDASSANAALDGIGNKAAQMAAKVDSEASKAGRAVDGIGAGANNSAEQFTRAESKISASIKRSTEQLALLNKTASQKIEYKIEAQGLDPAKFQGILTELKKVEAAQAAASIAIAQGTRNMSGLGVSAAQTAAALRGVPAQFTDIITSLQGGQAPMTVFLQQGGQLKDMFGGAGNAARALGGYVLGLINPFTIAAAAAGVLAVAYNQGSKEAEAFSKALILTGNASGTTSNMMADTAASISKASGVTKAAAADAIAQLAGTTGIAASSFEKLGASAVRFSAVSGVAVGDVVKQFSELAKDPLVATLKLNDSTNFLTRSVYLQIKALDEQGNSTKAAALAQSAWADALASRSIQMEQNLGTVERAWAAVKKGAKEAWDAMLNVGRETTPAQQLEEINRQIAEKERQIANGGFSSTGGGAAVGSGSQAVLNRINAEVVALRAKAAALGGVAEAARYSAEQQAKAASEQRALGDWDKDGLKFLTDKAKMQREITAARTQGLAAGRSELEIETRIKAIRESYNKKGATPVIKADAWQTDVAKSYVQAMAELEKVQAGASASAQGLSKSQAALKSVMAAPEWAAYTRQQKEQIIYAASLAQGAEDEAEAQKQVAKVVKEAHDEYKKMLDAQSKITEGVDAHVLKLRDEAEATAMAAERNISLAQAIELVTIKRLEEKQVGAMGNEDMVAAIQKEIDARKKLASEISGKDMREKEASAWKDIWSSLDSTAKRVWTDVWHGGQDAFSKVRDTVKALLLDLTYMMAKRWVISIVGSTTGASALAQTAGNASGMSSIPGMGWLTDFGGSATNALSQLGGKIGGDWGQSLISNADSLGSAMNTMGEGLGYLNSVLAASKGQWGRAAGSAIGTYFGGPIGSIIGSTVGSWVDSMFGGGSKPSIEGGFSTSGNPATNGRTYTMGADGQYYGGAMDSTAKALVTGSAKDYATIVKAAGRNAAELTAQAFVGIDQGGKGSPNKLDYAAFLGGKQIYNRGVDLGTNNAGTTDAQMTDAAKEATTKAVLAALAETDLGPQLNAYLETVKINGASLAEVTASLGDVTGFIDFSRAVRSLPIDYLTSASVAVERALVTAAGGLDNFKSSLSTYIDLFYSDTEKTAIKTQTLTDAFKDLGITMPAVGDNLRAWYRSEVERLGAMDLSVAANAEAYASILALANSVNALAPAAAQAAAAVQESADAIAATRQGWQNRLDVLNGTTTDRALALQADLASTTDEATKALIRMVYAMEDARTASSQAAATLAEQTAAAERLAAEQKAAAEQARASAISGAKSAVDRAINAERERVTAIVSQRDTALTGIKSVFDLLQASTRDLYAQVSSTAAMSAVEARAYIATALTMARAGGVVPDQGALSEAITAARAGVTAGQYRTQVDADRARLVLAGELSQLQDVAGDQLTEAERALGVAKDQLTALDKQAQYAQDLVDIANGIDTSVKTIPEALAALAAAIGSSAAAAAAAADASKAATLGLMSAVTNPGTTGDPNSGAKFGGGNVTYYTPNATPATQDQLDKIFKYGIGLMGGVTAFDVGTNVVPRDMLALIHEGEAVVPKAYNPALGSSSSDQATAAEVRALRATVELLIDVSRDTASNTKKTRDVLVSVTEDGSAMKNEAA